MKREIQKIIKIIIIKIKQECLMVAGFLYGSSTIDRHIPRQRD